MLVVADSAYAGGELKALPAGVTWTTRLRKDVQQLTCEVSSGWSGGA